MSIFDALRDLVPFVQFKNVKNTHGAVLILVNFLNCTNDTKTWNPLRFSIWANFWIITTERGY